MIKTGTKVFLQIPDDSEKRILHPGKVVEVNEANCTAQLEEKGLSLEDGIDLLIYYYHEINRKFTQQPARIDSVIQTEPNIMVGLEPTGDAVSVESRTIYRVSAIAADLKAKFGPEENCPVVDISPMGFALYATESYEIGRRVEAVLNYKGEEFSGSVGIMNINKLGKGKMRYGVLYIDDAKSGAGLKKGLTQVSLAVQREQLARVSGLA